MDNDFESGTNKQDVMERGSARQNMNKMTFVEEFF